MFSKISLLTNRTEVKLKKHRIPWLQKAVLRYAPKPSPFMNFEDFLNRYILSDCQVLAFRLEYESKRFELKLKVRRHLAKQKFEPCLIEFEFTGVSELYFFEDFPTDGGCTDVTFVKIDNKGFYLSLDPYGNTGIPHEEDNLVVKADGLTFIDEEGVRQNIS